MSTLESNELGGIVGPPVPIGKELKLIPQQQNIYTFRYNDINYHFVKNELSWLLDSLLTTYAAALKVKLIDDDSDEAIELLVLTYEIPTDVTKKARELGFKRNDMHPTKFYYLGDYWLLF